LQFICDATACGRLTVGRTVVALTAGAGAASGAGTAARATVTVCGSCRQVRCLKASITL